MERRIQDILFDARSLGGIGTVVSMPEFSVSVDIGLCTSAALRTDTILLTHGHADHLAGLATWLGVRRLYGMRPGRIVVPAGLEDSIRTLIGVLGDLQRRPYEVDVLAVEVGDEVALSNGLLARPFAVDHGVPGVGWAIVRRVTKLRAEHHGMPGARIAELKQDPANDLFETRDESLVAVTGDTTAAGLDVGDPVVSGARVLFVEATFVDQRRTVDHAHLGHHSHLDELAPVLQHVRSPAIVLYHFSQIYRPGEVEAAVASGLPPDVASRVHLWLPEEGDRL
jgi:ribonuclease Z